MSIRVVQLAKYYLQNSAIFVELARQYHQVSIYLLRFDSNFLEIWGPLLRFGTACIAFTITKIPRRHTTLLCHHLGLVPATSAHAAACAHRCPAAACAPSPHATHTIAPFLYWPRGTYCSFPGKDWPEVIGHGRSSSNWFAGGSS